MAGDSPPPPGSRPLLERTLVRSALAIVLLAALVGGLLAVKSSRGGSASAPAASNGTPGASASPPSDAGLGPLDGGPPLIGQMAPDFALRRSDGTVVKLSDLRGKVVWINFWASWCVPCRQEIPDIQAVYQQKRDAGLEVLEVNWKDDLETANGFFQSRSINLPLLMDTSGSVYDQYRLQGLPDSFFIDRDGKIAAQQFGYLTQETMLERLQTAGLD